MRYKLVAAVAVIISLFVFGLGAFGVANAIFFGGSAIWAFALWDVWFFTDPGYLIMWGYVVRGFVAFAIIWVIVEFLMLPRYAKNEFFEDQIMRWKLDKLV